jgi:hypothetical protein
MDAQKIKASFGENAVELQQSMAKITGGGTIMQIDSNGINIT